MSRQERLEAVARNARALQVHAKAAGDAEAYATHTRQLKAIEAELEAYEDYPGQRIGGRP
jgi:hypothetical protein